jgi:tRNA (guanine6-N2)-methyltransferase
MRYLLTTVQGLEDVVVEEIAEKLGASSARSTYMSGRVVADVDAPPSSLLALRSVERFGVFITSGTFSALGDIVDGVRAVLPEILSYLSPYATAGVACERAGTHPFTSRDVESAVGSLLKEAGATISLVDPDLELNVDVVGDAYYVWLTSARRSLKDRPYRRYQHYASLNPIVAYAMARLVRLRDGETLCDLTCGGGTICLEASSVARVRCICVDISLKHLRGALENFSAAGADADVLWFDSTKLHRALRPICDAFAFNTPYGVRIPANVYKLYRGLARAVELLARPGARVAVVTPRWRAFLKYFGGEVLERRVIYQGGLYSSIVVGKVK